MSGVADGVVTVAGGWLLTEFGAAAAVLAGALPDRSSSPPGGPVAFGIGADAPLSGCVAGGAASRPGAGLLAVTSGPACSLSLPEGAALVVVGVGSGEIPAARGGIGVTSVVGAGSAAFAWESAGVSRSPAGISGVAAVDSPGETSTDVGVVFGNRSWA